MFLEEKYEGEPQEQWPRWYKLLDEPLTTTEFGVWFSYVVLPQPDKKS